MATSRDAAVHINVRFVLTVDRDVAPNMRTPLEKYSYSRKVQVCVHHRPALWTGLGPVLAGSRHCLPRYNSMKTL